MIDSDTLKRYRIHPTTIRKKAGLSVPVTRGNRIMSNIAIPIDTSKLGIRPQESYTVTEVSSQFSSRKITAAYSRALEHGSSDCNKKRRYVNEPPYGMIPLQLPLLMQMLSVGTENEAEHLVKKNKSASYRNIAKVTNLGVRIHSGSYADRLAKHYNADALTIGKNIFFSSGQLDLASPKGISLLAHELQHVIQQEREHGLMGRDISPAKYSSLEREAFEKEKEVLTSFEVNRTTPNSHDNKNPRVMSYEPKSFPGQREDLYEKNRIQEGNRMEKKQLDSLPTNIESAVKPSGNEMLYALPSSTLISGGSTSASTGKLDRELAVPNIVPLMAQKDREIGSVAAAIPPVTTRQPSDSVDIEHLSDKVYRLILGKIRAEKDRRGIR